MTAKCRLRNCTGVANALQIKISLTMLISHGIEKSTKRTPATARLSNVIIVFSKWINDFCLATNVENIRKQH